MCKQQSTQHAIPGLHVAPSNGSRKGPRLLVVHLAGRNEAVPGFTAHRLLGYLQTYSCHLLIPCAVLTPVPAQDSSGVRVAVGRDAVPRARCLTFLHMPATTRREQSKSTFSDRPLSAFSVQALQTLVVNANKGKRGTKTQPSENGQTKTWLRFFVNMNSQRQSTAMSHVHACCTSTHPDLPPPSPPFPPPTRPCDTNHNSTRLVSCAL
jgi:hypothetical protein